MKIEYLSLGLMLPGLSCETKHVTSISTAVSAMANCLLNILSACSSDAYCYIP